MKRQVAVALKYDSEQDAAPRIAAKGWGFLAEKILEAARKHGLPLHRDTNLAEILAVLELNQVIPEELYPVISEILAYVYSVNNRAGTLLMDRRA